MIKKKLEEKDIRIGINLLCKVLQKSVLNINPLAKIVKFFVERKEICDSRSHYLRTVKDFRRRGYRIVYLDETWINKNHCLTKSWLPSCDINNIINIVENKNMKLPNIRSGKGTRLIILHAGCSETGFIEGCELVFIGKDVDGDYHREMNSTVFIDWFRNTLIPALGESSLIVLDNASYLNLRTADCKAPTSSTKKGDMQHWLSERGIQFDILAKKNPNSMR